MSGLRLAQSTVSTKSLFKIQIPPLILPSLVWRVGLAVDGGDDHKSYLTKVEAAGVTLAPLLSPSFCLSRHFNNCSSDRNVRPLAAYMNSASQDSPRHLKIGWQPPADSGVAGAAIPTDCLCCIPRSELCLCEVKLQSSYEPLPYISSWYGAIPGALRRLWRRASEVSANLRESTFKYDVLPGALLPTLEGKRWWKGNLMEVIEQGHYVRRVRWCQRVSRMALKAVKKAKQKSSGQLHSAAAISTLH